MLYSESMIDRRLLLQLLATSSTAVTATAAVKPVFKQTLPKLELDGWVANALEVSYGPGEESHPHQHPGFVLGYVLEGEIRFQVRGEPEKLLKAGEMFYEQPGSVHQVSGNASKTKPARLLALILAPAGAPLTKPA